MISKYPQPELGASGNSLNSRDGGRLPWPTPSLLGPGEGAFPDGPRMGDRQCFHAGNALSSLLLGLLLSKAPCHQRGSCPDRGQCDGEVETERICPPPQREEAGASENLPRLQLAQMALPWLLTFCRCDGCLQEPARVCLPASHPPTAAASPT